MFTKLLLQLFIRFWFLFCVRLILFSFVENEPKDNVLDKIYHFAYRYPSSPLRSSVHLCNKDLYFKFEICLHLSSSPCRPKQFHRYDDFYIECTYRIMFRFFSVVTTCYFVKAHRVFPPIHYTRIVFQNVRNYDFIAFLFYFTMMLNCRHKIVFSI